MKIDRLIHRQDKRKKTFIRALIFCLGSHEHLTCLLLLVIKEEKEGKKNHKQDGMLNQVQHDFAVIAYLAESKKTTSTAQ